MTTEMELSKTWTWYTQMQVQMMIHSLFSTLRNQGRTIPTTRKSKINKKYTKESF